ncbi:MAG TPA: hypothetical protein VM099_09850 [Gemmatimonadaceae bacterium]|nr:hypothetical protein [Gemmatimonadaceae bacterium]
MKSIFRGLAFGAALVTAISTRGITQSEYRNMEGGRPVRVSDASPTELHGLDLDLTTVRVDKLSFGRYRLQVEPRLSYGIRPRADISIRTLGFYREPSAIPRGTIAGIGIGGEYQVKMETLRSPALALAGEVWAPTGPNASVPSYSLKGLATRSFTFGRVHLNASYGTYSIKIPVPPPGGTLIPPIVDGPCMMSPSDGGLSPRASCSTSFGVPLSLQQAAALKPGTNTGAHWLWGVAVDHSFPLRSLLLIGDVFSEGFEGLGRRNDWTAEVGARKQLTTRLVTDLSVGRHFEGVSLSWFATFGTTLSYAFGR